MSADMPELHPEAQLMVNYLNSQGKDRYAGKSVDEIRKNHSLSSATASGAVDYRGNVTDILIPNKDSEEKIPARIYEPEGHPKDPVIWVYFHGGGLVLGSIGTCEAACKTIAMKSQAIVVNIEYRLAPEFKVPAQMDDGVTATKWVLDNKITVGGSEKSSVGVGGDSGGGTIAASVAHDVPGLDFQVLIYPHVIQARDHTVVPSQTKYKDGPLLTSTLIDWFENQSIPIGMENHPRYASIRRERFDHLPSALIIAAEIDPLRDEAELYQKLLVDAGVKCEVFEVKGVLHAFFTQPGIYKTTSQIAYDKVATFIQTFTN